jgi:hypothetical protein
MAEIAVTALYALCLIWVALVVGCVIGGLGALVVAWVSDALRQPRHRIGPDELTAAWVLPEPVPEPVPAATEDAVVLPDRWTPDLTEEELWWVPVPSQRTGCTTGGDDALSRDEAAALADRILGMLGPSLSGAQDELGGGSSSEAASAASASLCPADDAAWEWIDRTVSEPWYTKVVDLGDVQEGVGEECCELGAMKSLEGDGDGTSGV